MNNKIVTICGSMKFMEEMIRVSQELELKHGYVIIQCIYGIESNNYNELDIEKLGQLHFKKIDISDGIYVVNVGGYIGDSTRKEIEYAKNMGKEVMYLES